MSDPRETIGRMTRAIDHDGGSLELSRAELIGLRGLLAAMYGELEDRMGEGEDVGELYERLCQVVARRGEVRMAMEGGA